MTTTVSTDSKSSRKAPGRSRKGVIVIILGLFLSIFGASFGVNAGAVAPEQVPVAMQQEAEAHGNHPGDPCAKNAFPTFRYGSLLRAIGTVDCGVTNGHAKLHHVYVHIEELVTEKNWYGKEVTDWEPMKSHRSPRRGAVPITKDLSAQPTVQCPKGKHKVRTVVQHGVNGDLGPQFWTKASTPTTVYC